MSAAAAGPPAGDDPAMVEVSWHAHGRAHDTRREWIELPRPHTPLGRMTEYVSAYLREREGLPADDHRPSSEAGRALWFEWGISAPAPGSKA